MNFFQKKKEVVKKMNINEKRQVSEKIYDMARSIEKESAKMANIKHGSIN